MNGGLKRLQLRRGIGDPQHVGRVGGQRESSLGQFPAKCLHALPATVVDRATCLYLLVRVGKDLRKVLHHATGNATVLLGTQGCEFAAISLGIFPYLG